MNEQIALALGNLTYETAINRKATSHMTQGQRDALRHLLYAAIEAGEIKLEINHEGNVYIPLGHGFNTLNTSNEYAIDALKQIPKV